MDEIFNYCVELLYYWGDIVGLSYKEINVWIFVIIEPIIFIIMLVWIIRLRKKIKQKKETNKTAFSYLQFTIILKEEDMPMV